MRRAGSIWLAIVLGSLGLSGGLLGLAYWLSEALSWRDVRVLWLVAAVGPIAGLVVTAWHMRQRGLGIFGAPETTRTLVIGRSGALRAIRGVALVLGLAFMIVTLAGPQYGSRTRMLRKRGIDIVIALDFSKSMLAQDVRPDRISRAKAELMRFIEELDGDRVGIVAFAGETMEFPMTVDYAAIDLFLRDLGPYDMPVGGTAIGRALIASKRLLDRGRPQSASDDDPAEQADRVVILMTDGEDQEGDPVEAAHELAEAGIRIYTIGIGSRSGEAIPTYGPDGTWTGYLRDDDGNPVTTSLTAENEHVLREVAETTHGRYFRADQGSVGIDQIRREIRRMKQAERDARRITVQEDRYALVLLAAFLLIVLEALLPEAWIGRRKQRRVEAA